MAFASNLLGAMVGGALEYVALLTGFRMLLIVVAVLYSVAFLLAGRYRFLADTSLVQEDARGVAPRPDGVPPWRSMWDAASPRGNRRPEWGVTWAIPA